MRPGIGFKALGIPGCGREQIALFPWGWCGDRVSVLIGRGEVRDGGGAAALAMSGADELWESWL